VQAWRSFTVHFADHTIQCVIFGSGYGTWSSEVDQCVGSGTALSVHYVTMNRNKSHQNKRHKRWSFVSCEPHSVRVTVQYVVCHTHVVANSSGRSTHICLIVFKSFQMWSNVLWNLVCCFEGRTYMGWGCSRRGCYWDIWAEEGLGDRKLETIT
jgi:hypothetical protein